MATDKEINPKVLAKAVATGLRYDEGKNRLELIPVEWIWGLGDVLTQGAKKYADRNWEQGMLWSKMVGCALRHTFKFVIGERYDAETGCHHLAMAAWNLLALMSYDLRETGINDLPGSTTRGMLDNLNMKTSGDVSRLAPAQPKEGTKS